MKSRKVLTILLSLAIMVTFMPTFAFAAYGDDDHDFAQAADKSNVKYIVEPTCEDPGLAIVTCKDDSDGTCTATRYEQVARLHHVRGSKTISVTAEEYYNKCLEMGYDKEDMDEWMEDYGQFICVGNVYVCQNCGAFMATGGDREALTNPASFARYASSEHVAPANTKACAESFVCDLCGKKDATNSTHNPVRSAVYHGFNVTTGAWTLNNHMVAKGTPYDVHTKTTATGNVSVTAQNYECDQKCGFEHANASYPTGTSAADFTHPNTKTTTVEPTCTEQGFTSTYCTDCGAFLSSQGKPALGHTYVDKVTAATEAIDAEHDGYAKTYKQCSVCGEEDWTGSENVGVPLNHSVKVTLLAPATCIDNSWILVKCENDPCALGIDSSVIVNDEDQVEKVGAKYYFTFAGQKVEVPFEKATGHKYGDAKAIVEATCESPAIEGRVCETCGSILHDGAREVGKALGHDPLVKTVVATCGTEGYTCSVCKRCDEYLGKDGKVLPEGAEWKWDVVAPIVGYGTECKFEWKVTKPATETEDGEKALVCSVCGDVKDGSQTLIPADVATAEKKAAVEAATPAVEAAADVIDNAKVYTTKSVAAVKEAKDMLNAAIASGTAADVKAMTENLEKAVAAVAEKAANTMTASGKTVKASAKKTKTFKKAAAFNVKNAKGKVTFAKKSGNSKIVVTSAGKVTVKKGLKKGKTYNVKVAVKAAGNGDYKAKTKVVTLKVKVNK